MPSRRSSNDERREYERLRAKYGTGRRVTPRRDDDEDDDEGGVFVLSGRAAESFLDRMFGPGRPGDDDQDDEDDEGDDDEGDDDQGDPEPDRQSHRFFRGRQRG